MTSLKNSDGIIQIFWHLDVIIFFVQPLAIFFNLALHCRHPKEKDQYISSSSLLLPNVLSWTDLLLYSQEMTLEPSIYFWSWTEKWKVLDISCRCNQKHQWISFACHIYFHLRSFPEENMNEFPILFRNGSFPFKALL